MDTKCFSVLNKSYSFNLIAFKKAKKTSGSEKECSCVVFSCVVNGTQRDSRCTRAQTRACTHTPVQHDHPTIPACAIGWCVDHKTFMKNVAHHTNTSFISIYTLHFPLVHAYAHTQSHPFTCPLLKALCAPRLYEWLSGW